MWAAVRQVGADVRGSTFNHPFLGIRRDQTLPYFPVFCLFLPVLSEVLIKFVDPPGTGSPPAPFPPVWDPRGHYGIPLFAIVSANVASIFIFE